MFWRKRGIIGVGNRISVEEKEDIFRHKIKLSWYDWIGSSVLPTASQKVYAKSLWPAFVCLCLFVVHLLVFLGLPSQKFHNALIACSRVCSKEEVRVCKVQRSGNRWHFPTAHVILFCFVLINYKFQHRRSLLKKIASGYTLFLMTGYYKYCQILIWGQVFIVIIDLTLKLKIKCLLWTYISILYPRY